MAFHRTIYIYSLIVFCLSFFPLGVRIAPGGFTSFGELAGIGLFLVLWEFCTCRLVDAAWRFGPLA